MVFFFCYKTRQILRNECDDDDKDDGNDKLLFLFCFHDEGLCMCIIWDMENNFKKNKYI